MYGLLWASVPPFPTHNRKVEVFKEEDWLQASGERFDRLQSAVELRC